MSSAKETDSGEAACTFQGVQQTIPCSDVPVAEEAIAQEVAVALGVPEGTEVEVQLGENGPVCAGGVDGIDDIFHDVVILS